MKILPTLLFVAQMRMTNEFREFGMRYATNSPPSLLLEFAGVVVDGGGMGRAKSKKPAATWIVVADVP